MSDDTILHYLFVLFIYTLVYLFVLFIYTLVYLFVLFIYTLVYSVFKLVTHWSVPAMKTLLSL